MRKHIPIPELTEADLERFWAKINIRGPDECWEWTACTNNKSYGLIGYGGRSGNLYVSTRWAYFIEHGVDPGDKQVCHSCDNPPCCNPAHLWLGTNKENCEDAAKKGRSAKQKGEQNQQATLTEKNVREILASDELQEVLAERYGVSPITISHIKTGKTWKHIQTDCKKEGRHAHGERNGSAKLTEKDVREILASDEPGQVLAKRYGVYPGTISKIKTGRTWKHLEINP